MPRLAPTSSKPHGAARSTKWPASSASHRASWDQRGSSSQPYAGKSSQNPHSIGTSYCSGEFEFTLVNTRGALASYVANEPAPILALLPTEADCRDYTVSDLEPIFEATPALRGLISADADEAGRSTLLSRRFPGNAKCHTVAHAPRRHPHSRLPPDVRVRPLRIPCSVKKKPPWPSITRSLGARSGRPSHSV